MKVIDILISHINFFMKIILVCNSFLFFGDFFAPAIATAGTVVVGAAASVVLLTLTNHADIMDSWFVGAFPARRAFAQNRLVFFGSFYLK